MLGGIVMHQGKVAEIKTGEGKTYAAMLPAYLRALSGQKVHIITQNDYLARRDYGQTRRLYEFLGLTTGVITQRVFSVRLIRRCFSKILDEIVGNLFLILIGIFTILLLRRALQRVLVAIDSILREEIYKSDIVFTTPLSGFDLLTERLSQEQIYDTFAIVDEADYFFIDLNGSALALAYVAEAFEGGWIIRGIAERLNPDSDYETKDAYVKITPEGEAKAKAFLERARTMKVQGIEEFPDDSVALRLIEIYLRVKAHYSNGIDYIVEDNRIKVIDTSTGRIRPNSRFSLGLHTFLELKEGLRPWWDRHWKMVPVPVFFRLYRDKAGMTGTIDFPPAREELRRVFGIADVVVIPTRRPSARVELMPKIFVDKQRRYEAIADKISKIREFRVKGQPVLIGTTLLSESEELSEILGYQMIEHKLLNARTEKQERTIVKAAGKRGAVTVATNMAGRGVDIKLSQEAREAGGLFVIFTRLSRTSPRLDRQLQGRAGRQGQPGQTQGFLLLSDYISDIPVETLTISADGSIDLERHPEILELVRISQLGSEGERYLHNLIQFMLDYVFFQQELVAYLAGPYGLDAKWWQNFCLWRDRYLLYHGDDVYTEEGYRRFKETSLGKFNEFMPKELLEVEQSKPDEWDELSKLFSRDGLKRMTEADVKALKEELGALTRRVRETEARVLGGVTLPQRPIRRMSGGDIFIRRMLFCLLPFVLLLGRYLFPHWFGFTDDSSTYGNIGLALGICMGGIYKLNPPPAASNPTGSEEIENRLDRIITSATPQNYERRLRGLALTKVHYGRRDVFRALDNLILFYVRDPRKTEPIIRDLIVEAQRAISKILADTLFSRSTQTQQRKHRPSGVRNQRKSSGFTLVESLLATVALVGLGWAG